MPYNEDFDIEVASDAQPLVNQDKPAGAVGRLPRMLLATGLTWARRGVFVASIAACILTGIRCAKSTYALIQEPHPATSPAVAPAAVSGAVQLNEAWGMTPEQQKQFQRDMEKAGETQSNPAADAFNFVFLLICLGLQFYAYKRSRGVPMEITDGLVAADKNQVIEDIYGEQLKLTQVIKIKELCGIEAKNKYTTDDGSLYISERSDCCQRVIASTNRELTLFAHAGPSEQAPVVMRMYKPYHLQGCCFCRPKMVVDLPDGSNIGHVEDPCRCCMIDQQIFDDRDMLKFKVNGTLCQCGACCPLCADFNFKVTDNVGMPVGSITKPKLSCKECCLKTNRFTLDYPKQATMDDKRLLTAATMLLDLQYFEQNKNQH